MSIQMVSLFLLVSASLLVVWEVRSDSWLRNRWYRAAVTVVLAVFVSPLAYHLLEYALSSESRKAESQFREKQESFMVGVSAALSDEGAESDRLAELLRFRYSEIFEDGDVSSQGWIGDLIDSLPQETTKFRQLKADEAELAERLEARWAPLYEYIRRSFGEKIDGLGAMEGVSITRAQDTWPLFAIESRQRFLVVGSIEFSSGGELLLRLDQGFVRGGDVEQRAQLILLEGSDVGNPVRNIFQFGLVNGTLITRSGASVGSTTLHKDPLSPENREVVEEVFRSALKELVLRAGVRDNEP